ncbi:MAG: hypothetical protein ABR549_06385 [Mycobacteriales bacterium]
MKRTTSRVLVAATATGWAAGLLVVAARHSQAGGTFRATSAATAVTAQLSNPDQLPLSATAEGSTQTAQAVVDQLGTSQGFASSPYPGGFVLGVPGLVAGAGGPSLPVEYPLYVSSDRETRPKAEATGPTYALRSVSTEGSTHASAVGSVVENPRARSGRASAEATSSVAGDGSISATGTTEIDNFTVAGVVSLARVSSRVTATRSPTGKLSRSSHLELEGGQVAGQQIALANGQLVVAGTKQPLPESPLAATLAQAGVTLATVGPADDPNGRTGGAVIVTITNTNDATSSSRATYRLGSATAFVTFGGSPDDQQPTFRDDGSSQPPVTSGTGSAPTGTGSGELAGPGLPPITAGPDRGLPGGPSVAGPTPALRPANAALPLPKGIAWLYFCFVAASTAILLSAQLIRMYGVKARL